MQTTLKAVGNSYAVIIPKALRERAGIGAGDAVDLDTPRAGVIVVRTRDDGARRANALEEMRSLIEKDGAWDDWPEGETADAVIVAARAERFGE